MKRNLWKSTILICLVILTLILSACENSLLVNVTKLYTVNFETNCDIKIDSYRTNKIETIQKLTKENYEFGGWYTNASFEGKQINFPYEVTENITLYSKWLPTFNVSFVTNCDTEIDSQKKGKIDSIQKLTKENYEFLGWYTNASFEGDSITFPYEVIENITLYAQWLPTFNVTFVTNCDTEIDSQKKGRIKSLQELSKDGYEFGGWYTSASFEGDAITFPYDVKNDTTFYALWIEKLKTYTFTSAQIKYSPDYVNGILTLKPEYEKYIFKSYSSDVFNGLCIKLSDSWTSQATIVFDNFSFTSSSSSPLIESPVDLVIEYYGKNDLSSSASSAIPLIKSSGIIEIKSNDKDSKLELQPNTVTSSTEGSVGIKANKVIINGGTLEIKKSDGQGYSSYFGWGGRTGGNGSSGIEAYETVIKNNAIVYINAGNGGNGGTGEQGSTGEPGWNREWIWQGKAGTGDKGGKGGAGGKGGNGGNAIVGDLKITDGVIYVKAGTGGTGGKGGKGGAGGKGGNNTAWGGGTGDGGTGGEGGTGGKGGNGGDAVTGTYTRNGGTIHLFKGEAGNGGEGGLGGDGGKPGTANNMCAGGGNYGNSGKSGEKGAPGTPGIEHR